MMVQQVWFHCYYQEPRIIDHHPYSTKLFIGFWSFYRPIPSYYHHDRDGPHDEISLAILYNTSSKSTYIPSRSTSSLRTMFASCRTTQISLPELCLLFQEPRRLLPEPHKHFSQNTTIFSKKNIYFSQNYILLCSHSHIHFS